MLIIQTNSIPQFEKRYSQELAQLRASMPCELEEDIAPFGDSPYLIAGAVFVVESIKSGVIYDLIKLFLTRWFTPPDLKQQNTHFSYYVEERKQGKILKRKRVEIAIASDKKARVKIEDNGTVEIDFK